MDWNRYSYVRYNPLGYTDPSGHAAECSAAGGEGCGPKPTPTVSPTEIPGIVIITMPPGSEPPALNEDLESLFGNVSAGVDAAEGITSILSISNPGWALVPGLISLGDFTIATWASVFGGEFGPNQLDPSLPPMFIVAGQDMLFTAVESLLAGTIQAGSIAVGGYLGGAPGAGVGNAIGSFVDLGTSAGSVLYDTGRADGTIPTKVLIGVFLDQTATTRIPLPGAPAGMPRIAIIYYE